MSTTEYLYYNFDIESLVKDFGPIGLDFIKTLTVEELENYYSDYKVR